MMSSVQWNLQHNNVRHQCFQLVIMVLRFFSMNTCSKPVVLCNPIIPACMRCVDSSTGSTELGGSEVVWGAADSEEERKGRVQREHRKKERQIESEIEKCSVRGYGPLCPAGDYRWHSELNQNCADCQGMGSATHRVPQERGVRLAPREGAEGEGCSHRVKIAFKWVFEISKNILPLK